MEENFYHGLQFAFKKSNSAVAYCSLTIRCGTRSEDPQYSGLAHLTEHMIFKGTSYHNATSINSYIEKLGGELNAYTTKEEIVLHSTVLKEDLNKAVGLLVELAFCPVFPEKELKKEKVVVLDEINSYKDSPSDQIFDDFEEYLFSGSDLSMPVLGKAKTLRKIDTNILKEFVKKNFRPENMAFSIVADMDGKHAGRMLMNALKKYVPADMDAAPAVSAVSEEKPVFPSFSKKITKKSHQAHCIIGAPAYSYYDQRRMALILLVNILGGPAANARLNILLREKNALVYNVEASYGQYSDTGVVNIYFGCDRIYFDKCVKLVEEELDRFREILMPQRTLKQGKKQLLGQLAISSDNGEAQCLSMGKSLMVFGEVLEVDKMRSMIEAVTSEQIRDVARDIFAKDNLSRLIYY